MRNRTDKRKGNAIVEFAVASSAIFLMSLGAIDFGRLFYESITLAGAAQAGTQRGTYTHVAADDSTAIQSAATASLGGVSGVTVTTEQFCTCPDAPSTGVDCTTAQCSGYGLSRMYVRTRVQKNYDTMGPWPGIPETTDMDLSSWMRVR